MHLMEKVAQKKEGSEKVSDVLMETEDGCTYI